VITDVTRAQFSLPHEHKIITQFISKIIKCKWRKKHENHHSCRPIVTNISEFSKTTLVLLWLLISDVIVVQLRYIQAPQEMTPCWEVPAKTN